MSDSAICPKCGRTVLLRVIPETGGLCMPCYKKITREKAAQEREQIESLRREQAVIIPENDAATAFLSECAAYCQLDCCGFNALDISYSTFLSATKTCGLDVANRALIEMRDHIRLIGNHTGLVKVFGNFEPAENVIRNFALCVAILWDVIETETLHG